MPQIKLTQTPKEGDLAVLKYNFDYGLDHAVVFTRFTKNDEEIASSNDNDYYVLTNRKL